MDWKSIVKGAAPMIGTALGTPLAGAAVALISNAVLGKSDGADTDIASAVIDLAKTPEGLAQLKNLDALFNLLIAKENAEIEKQKIDAENTKNAREINSQNKDNFPRILAVVITLGFFAVVFCSMFGNLSAQSVSIANILIGVLGTAFITIIGYYFGSSAGSASKEKAISSLMSPPIQSAQNKNDIFNYLK